MSQCGGLVLSRVNVPAHHMRQGQTVCSILSLGDLEDRFPRRPHGNWDLNLTEFSSPGIGTKHRLASSNVTRRATKYGLIKLHIGDDVEHLGHLVGCLQPGLQDRPERRDQVGIHRPLGTFDTVHPLREARPPNLHQLWLSTKGHEVTLEGSTVAFCEIQSETYRYGHRETCHRTADICHDDSVVTLRVVRESFP